MKRLLVVALFAAAPALAQVEVEGAWVRATAPGARLAAGYLTIHNRAAAPERLLGAASPAAARVEMHVHVRDGDIVRMREVQGYDIAANGSFALRPGGAHLMFVDIRHPYREGEKLPVTLRFARAGEVQAEFHVGRLGKASVPR